MHRMLPLSLSLSYRGIGFGPGWGHWDGVDGRCRENDALDNELAFYQEIKTASKWAKWEMKHGLWDCESMLTAIQTLFCTLTFEGWESWLYAMKYIRLKSVKSLKWNVTQNNLNFLHATKANYDKWLKPCFTQTSLNESQYLLYKLCLTDGCGYETVTDAS